VTGHHASKSADLSDLNHNLRRRIDGLPMAREQIGDFQVLSVDFYPKEAQLVTFRDPSSFFVLYHPDCSNLVRDHLETLTRKVRAQEHRSNQSRITDVYRSFRLVLPWENTRRYDSTGLKRLHIKPRCTVRISQGLFKKLWTTMRGFIPTFLRRRQPRSHELFYY
jgi:hypothetical protein